MVNWVIGFEKQVHERGRETAIVHEGRSYTYSELNRDANRFANWIGDADVDRVSMYVPNVYEFFIVQLGALKAGVGAVPINYRFGRDTVEYVLSDAECEAIACLDEDAGMVAGAADSTGVEHVLTIGSSEHGTPLRETLEEQSPRTTTVPRRDDDLSNILYTSGTTGRPKGVFKSHRNLSAQTEGIGYNWKMTSDQTWVCAGPVYHDSGLGCSTLPVLRAGGTVVLHRWDVEQFLHEVETYQPDSAYIVGSMLNDLLNYDDAESWDTRSIKQVFVGGAPTDDELYDTIEEMYGIRISERLGMTEASIILSYPVGRPGEYSPRDEYPDHVRGSCGRPLGHHVEVRVVDPETGQSIDHGEGELQVRGETVFERYHNLPERTDEAFTENGWYRTGDKVRIDEDGLFSHVSRMDNMIITGGENVYPTSVEFALNKHPEIEESAVFPLPDEYWGERVCVAVVPHDGAELSEEEIIEFCKSSEEFADYQVPKQVFFRGSIPRTPTKTIRRRELTDEYEGAAPSAE